MRKVKKKKAIKKAKCDISNNLLPCAPPKFDVQNHRRLVKAYLYEFNKAIKKALKDDHLVKKMKISEEFIMPQLFSETPYCIHTISFTDKNMLKLHK